MNNDFLGQGLNDGADSQVDAGGLVFDLNAVEEDKGFEIIPKGDYEAIVDEQEFGESKAGNPMVTTKYKIVAGEFENRVIFDYWVLQGKGAEFGLAKLKKFLVRVSPETDLGSFNPQAYCDNGDGVGKECILKLGIQTQKKGEYKGEKRNTIKDVLAPSNTGDFI